MKRDKDTLESRLETSDIDSDSDEETISDDDNKDTSHAFTKDKTSGNVNNSLASMLNKACSSPANVTFIKDIRDKYYRPNNIPYLLVPTVIASIYRKMLTTAFKIPKGNCCRKNNIILKMITQKRKYYRTCTHFQRMHYFYFFISPSSFQLPGGIIWSTYLLETTRTCARKHKRSETSRNTTKMFKTSTSWGNFLYKFFSRK